MLAIPSLKFAIYTSEVDYSLNVIIVYLSNLSNTNIYHQCNTKINRTSTHCKLLLFFINCYCLISAYFPPAHFSAEYQRYKTNIALSTCSIDVIPVPRMLYMSALPTNRICANISMPIKIASVEYFNLPFPKQTQNVQRETGIPFIFTCL